MAVKSIGSELVLFKSNNLYKVWGDTGAEFTAFPIGDYGCMSATSPVKAEGGVSWLAPQGFYFYNGGAPSYIGENVRKIIDGLTFAEIQECLGFYRERTFYFSFPSQGFTLAYYTPSQQWYYLPYKADVAVTTDYPDNLAGVFDGVNLYEWDSNTASDLGSPITGTWTGAIEAGQAPGLTKEYRYLVLDAPNQANATATATLTLDGGVVVTPFSQEWNLADGSTAHVVSLPPGYRGYVGQLSLSVTGPPGTIIRNVYAVGTVVREPSVTAA
jgi:hypothetical protein